MGRSGFLASLLDSLADSALNSLLDSDALDAGLEECSELLEALSAVLWEELDEDAGFSSELPELLDVLPELAPEEDELEEPEEELLDALEWDELLEAASPLTVSVRGVAAHLAVVVGDDGVDLITAVCNRGCRDGAGRLAGSGLNFLAVGVPADRIAAGVLAADFCVEDIGAR